MNVQKMQQLALEDEKQDISVPNWLVDVLGWIKRTEMEQSSLITSCKIFKRLCWPKLYGNVEPHKIQLLVLVAERDEHGNLKGFVRNNAKLKLMPIPDVPPSDHILGFDTIFLSFLDDHVLKFIKCIAPKLNKIKFSINTMNMEEWGPKEVDERTKASDRLFRLLANKINYFSNGHRCDFNNFNRLFPGFINQIKSLWVYHSAHLDCDILFNWLTNRQIDGKEQKVLQLNQPRFLLVNFIDRIKQEFSNATEPHNFIIFCEHGLPDANFTMENKNTGEVLIRYRNRDVHNPMLIRCPKAELVRWKKEGEKKLLKYQRDEDEVSVDVGIKDFGTLNNLD